jgi:hypothetical protein
MELIGSLFLILALTVLVGLYIARPFLQPHLVGSADARSAEEHTEHLRSNLLAERDRVLETLYDLDFDNAMGKIPSEDYPVQRAALLKTGAEILRRLDEMDSAGGHGKQTGSTEERIEAAVAARRAEGHQRAGAVRGRVPAEMAAAAGSADGVAGNGSAATTKDELEELIATRKRARKESAGGFCPGCGRPVQKSDKFCSRCGTTL